MEKTGSVLKCCVPLHDGKHLCCHVSAETQTRYQSCLTLTRQSLAVYGLIGWLVSRLFEYRMTWLAISKWILPARQDCSCRCHESSLFEVDSEVPPLSGRPIMQHENDFLGCVLNSIPTSLDFKLHPQICGRWYEWQLPSVLSREAWLQRNADHCLERMFRQAWALVSPTPFTPGNRAALIQYNTANQQHGDHTQTTTAQKVKRKMMTPSTSNTMTLTRISTKTTRMTKTTPKMRMRRNCNPRIVLLVRYVQGRPRLYPESQIFVDSIVLFHLIEATQSLIRCKATDPLRVVLTVTEHAKCEGDQKFTCPGSVCRGGAVRSAVHSFSS